MSNKQEHPYAEILRAIADGKAIQYRYAARVGSGWLDFANLGVALHNLSNLYDIAERQGITDYEFRLKPQIININGTIVPMPVREAGEYVKTYYLASPTDTELAIEFKAGGGANIMQACFDSGLCHETKEAAVLHAKALLSFTSNIEE